MQNTSLSDNVAEVFQATLSFSRWLSIAALIIFCCSLAFVRFFGISEAPRFYWIPIIGYSGLLIAFGLANTAISLAKSAMIQAKLNESVDVTKLQKQLKIVGIVERLALVALVVGAGTIAYYSEQIMRNQSY